MSTTGPRKAFVRESTDGYQSSPTYSSASASYRARVVPNGERVMPQQGTETVTSHVAWLNSTIAWDVRDKFTHAGSTYRIIALDRRTDDTGVHHTKLYLRA